MDQMDSSLAMPLMEECALLAVALAHPSWRGSPAQDRGCGLCEWRCCVVCVCVNVRWCR